MIIRDEAQTGWPNATNLHQRVAAYTRSGRVSAFKIGITSDPFIRARHYAQKYGYDEMIVVYETKSDRYVRRMEQFLTEYFYRYADNMRKGGGGRSGLPPYFLYVVVKW